MTGFIMGMGVVIIATYMLLALLVAPALVQAGVPLIVAHFLIFYMGLTTFITPLTAGQSLLPQQLVVVHRIAAASRQCAWVLFPSLCPLS